MIKDLKVFLKDRFNAACELFLWSPFRNELVLTRNGRYFFNNTFLATNDKSCTQKVNSYQSTKLYSWKPKLNPGTNLFGLCFGESGVSFHNFAHVIWYIYNTVAWLNHYFSCKSFMCFHDIWEGRLNFNQLPRNVFGYKIPSSNKTDSGHNGWYCEMDTVRLWRIIVVHRDLTGTVCKSTWIELDYWWSCSIDITNSDLSWMVTGLPIYLEITPAKKNEPRM